MEGRVLIFREVLQQVIFTNSIRAAILISDCMLYDHELRAGHTRRQVAATRRGDKLLRCVAAMCRTNGLNSCDTSH